MFDISNELTTRIKLLILNGLLQNNPFFDVYNFLAFTNRKRFYSIHMVFRVVLVYSGCF